MFTSTPRKPHSAVSPFIVDYFCYYLRHYSHRAKICASKAKVRYFKKQYAHLFRGQRFHNEGSRSQGYFKST